MVSLVLTIIAFAGAMSVPAFLTAIVESAASKIRPSSSRTVASRRMMEGCASKPLSNPKELQDHAEHERPRQLTPARLDHAAQRYQVVSTGSQPQAVIRVACNIAERIGAVKSAKVDYANPPFALRALLAALQSPACECRLLDLGVSSKV